MMQSRRQHGSSGELDVFGATSYFAGLPDYCPSEPADRRLKIQDNQVAHATRMEDTAFRGPRHLLDEQLGLHDDERHDAQLGVAKTSGKSKLAALLSFMTSPSPRASFRKEPPPSPPTNKLQAGDEPAKVSSSSSLESSVQLQGCGVHELDLGVAMGDRRLQGIRVVRGSGDEERWVVRCSAWDEEHHERMLDSESSDPKEEVEEGDDGNRGDWESDSSSDLFDLDLLSTHADLST